MVVSKKLNPNNPNYSGSLLARTRVEKDKVLRKRKQMVNS